MPLGQAAGGAKPRRKPSRDKAFWRVSDFEYIGGFYLNQFSGNSLALRYHSGQLWVYFWEFYIGQHKIWRGLIPALQTDPNDFLQPTSTVSTSAISVHKEGRGMYYDWDSDTWFHFTFLGYDGAANLTPNMVSFNLDHTSMAVTNYKRIRSRVINPKGAKGVCAIPAEYQSRLDGHKLCYGFGGYESIISTGYLGPCAAAFSAQDVIDTPSLETLANDRLMMAHPYGINYGNAPFPGLRDRNTWTTADGAGGSGWQNHWPEGYGYWSVEDVRQGGFWLETASRKGFCLFANLAYNGEKATILSAVEDSATGSGANDDVTYTLTLDRALPGNRVGAELHCPNTNLGLWNRSVVQQITNSGLTVQTVVDGSQQQNGVNRFQLDVGNYCYFGTLYHSGTVWPTFRQPTLFVYDPEDLVNNTPAPTPVVSHEPFPSPTGATLFLQNDPNGKIASTAFDPTTNRLYVLNTWGRVYVYQVAA